LKRLSAFTPEISEEEILQKIISLNSSSEHPLAQATMRYGATKNIEILSVSDLKLYPEKALQVSLVVKWSQLGNEKLMEQVNAVVSDECETQVSSEQNLENSLLFV